MLRYFPPTLIPEFIHRTQMVDDTVKVYSDFHKYTMAYYAHTHTHTVKLWDESDPVG